MEQTPGISIDLETVPLVAVKAEVEKDSANDPLCSASPRKETTWAANADLDIVIDAQNIVKIEQVQEVAAGQAQVMPPPPMQRPLGQMGHLMPMDQWTSQRYGANPGLKLQQLEQVVQVPPQPQQAIGGMGQSHIGPSPNIRTQQSGTISTAVAGGKTSGGFAVKKRALQQLLTTLKSPNTPEQQAQILTILKSNPQLMAAFMKQTQAVILRAQKQNQANAVQEPGGVIVPNQQPQHQLQHVMTQVQLQQQVVQVPPQPQQANGGMGQSHIGPGPGPNIRTQQSGPSGTISIAAAGGKACRCSTNHKRALLQLLKTLKSPKTPEQQAQILQILKSNPKLMTAFIKHRQAFQLSQAQKQNQPNAVLGPGGVMVPNQQPQHQLQHAMTQQQQQGRMHVQAMLIQQGAAGPGVTPQGNQLTPQLEHQWNKYQQILAMQQQQQQQQQQAVAFQQPAPAPPYLQVSSSEENASVVDRLKMLTL